MRTIVSGMLTSSLVVAVATGAQTDRDLERGASLFAAHCARCHGLGGTGGEGPSLAQGDFRHVADDAGLHAIVREGIEGTTMPGTWMISDAEAWDIVAYVRSLTRVETGELRGDPERGEALYEGRGACAICHVVNGDGGVVGPELTDVGARRGVAHLEEALTDPAATVAPDYLVVRVVTRDGREVRGTRINEDSFTIQIRDEAGGLHSLEKSELAALDKELDESLMPSYASELAPSELDDLVAYLASLRGGR